MEETTRISIGYMLLLCTFNAVAGQNSTAEAPITTTLTTESSSTTTSTSTSNTTQGITPRPTTPISTSDSTSTTSNTPPGTAAVSTTDSTAQETTTRASVQTNRPVANATSSTTVAATTAAATSDVPTTQKTTSQETKSTPETETDASGSSTGETTTQWLSTAEKNTGSSTTISVQSTTVQTTKSPTTMVKDDEAMNVVLPVCLTLFGIVLIIFLIVLYLYCKGKELPCLGQKRRADFMEMPVTKSNNVPRFAVGHMAIGRDEFETQHKRKIADEGKGYREEFRAVHTESSTMAAARDPVNGPKNRYDNVLPWDWSRVELSGAADGKQCSDYINANFVPGYLQEKKFIACQGPKDNTCADFWKMVWEQKTAAIVMVTNLVEAKKIKCHQYWPGEDNGNTESAKYGDYLVTVVDVKIRNYYIMRTLKLQLHDNPTRMIRQLHYTAWPDFGVPKNPHELLLFRRRVLAANPPDSGPIIVHCSAGVGRTGTFILVDAAMEQLHAEGKVDLFSFLTKMRKHRMMLVQTEAQYTFAHGAILEHIKYGSTEVSVKKFRMQVHSLREYKEGSDGNILEEQFSSLLNVQLNKDGMKHGRQSIKKNRVLQIIPYDDNRVALPLKPGQETSDYVNASFIQGFKEKAAYIATQAPLRDTVADFWLMVWLNRSQSIIMLTGLEEKGQEMCAQYWPVELNEEASYGDINVKYVSKDDDDVVDYLVREFVITNSAVPDEPERKIRQFHYTGWPEIGSPSDPHGMIEIANRCSSKDKDGTTWPSIVHCSSGGGRTGVFIALNILMEQADNEGLVDVFQTVKSLRAQRPHIVQSQEQLYFCYAALLQYLETNQLAGDNTTLSSNINSSIGNQSESVATSTGAAPPTNFLRVDNTTPQGSMNNKLDVNSVAEQVTESKSSTGDVPQEATVRSPATLSTDSVNEALLKPAADDDNANSNSSHSDFEIVNENGQNGISV